ncbi:NADH dehydrogenase FAD-containing subunit [Herbihabitans rhizosphaerae]|uniref:NADH dehydrogenase FAD-containing subunit n=1 Tax=Herbihabitans rhizosphaerae TaxID=1872711 RepID=A0A4Q7L4I8_9PSEU|nr:FAD-dependent oxidoreductase [Herbihabitans rhizosphaerae]RZS44195.1 NADH dehydrogenase FAD-containing subunit [Herbihabitans rhizosphaerae]
MTNVEGHRVVVLGGGYAGLVTAHRLAHRGSKAGVSVTLVNAGPDFVERIRLHQIAAGQPVGVHPLVDVLDGSGIDVRVGMVTGIDPDARTVAVQGQPEIGYDTLVYALGSMIDKYAVPGVAEHAVTLSDPASAAGIAMRLRSIAERGGTVVVCGGGLTGIEASTELAETYDGLTVRVITKGEPGDWLSPRARRYLCEQFDRLGVLVTPNAPVAKIDADGVLLDDGERVDADMVVWCGGFTVPPIAERAGLEVNRNGRIVVDTTLRSVSHPEVYGVGDAAAVRGEWGDELAYGCRSGGFTSPYVADVIAARLAGREPKEFRFRYIQQCVSIGRKRGLVQYVNGADESPKRAMLGGRKAAWYKEMVCRLAAWTVRHPGPYLGRPTL